ncbi:hypothetical protein D4764_16G0001790 [Takifugu flavidus]|uniref:Uncharacterized protein n=1 Tax=Takifugu flavidus TaxID=433684 RepID=A0A5C6NW32_9TELE|nr:hypothetical protein D4764_16G0001790 [Takifugu flavidus]
MGSVVPVDRYRERRGEERRGEERRGEERRGEGFIQLDKEPARDEDLWGGRTDFRATARSVSHPELYVVGHALYRD